MKHNYQFYILGKGFYSQMEAASFFGVTRGFMSQVARGEREVTKGMAEKCGYKKVIHRTVEFVKLENGN